MMSIDELRVTLKMLDIKIYNTIGRDYLILDLCEREDSKDAIIDLLDKYNFIYIVNTFDNINVYIGDKYEYR